MKGAAILIKNSLIFVLSVFLLYGCATVMVPVQVTYPAEINMTPYKRIVIDEVKGNMGQKLLDLMKESLIEYGRFQVLDRTRLGKILTEHCLFKSDLSDPASKSRTERFLAASALFSGYTEGRYVEKVTTSQTTCGSKENRRPFTLFTRRGEVKITGNIDG